MTATTELDDYRGTVREWLAANLPRRTPDSGPADPHELTADEVAAGRELQKRVYDAGYIGISVPVEYGGRGLTGAHERIWQEESEGYEIPLPAGVASIVTTRVVLPTLLHNATEEQKRQWIPGVLSGGDIWVQLLSEPEAGSDLAGIRTQARRDGNNWILHGTKLWSSGAVHADYGICLARTDPDVPKHKGLTWFKVPLRDENVTVRPVRQLNGSDEFCEEFLDGVVLGEDMVIGPVNGGWKVANSLLMYERGAGHIDLAPSTAEARRKQAADLTELASGYDEFDVARRRSAALLIARERTKDWVHEALNRRITSRLMRGTGNPATASLVKLSIGTRGPQRALTGIELAGRASVAWRPGEPTAKVAENFFYGRQYAIAGGSNEIQRNIISERVLGLPREPSYDNDKPFRDVMRDARNWVK